MKLKKLATILLAGILSVGSVTPAFARQPKYESWAEFEATYGKYNKVYNGMLQHVQVWGAGKSGPETPTSNRYFDAGSLHVCKHLVSDSVKVKNQGGWYSTEYLRRNDGYKAICTYKTGGDSRTINYDFYIPCMRYTYYVDPSRSGDFWTTNINGKNYNYKKDPAVAIGNGSVVHYNDGGHNGSDIYVTGDIRFVLAHSPNGSWSSNDNGHWNTCTGCGGTVN